jgi:hypothetical protein
MTQMLRIGRPFPDRRKLRLRKFSSQRKTGKDGIRISAQRIPAGETSLAGWFDFIKNSFSFPFSLILRAPPRSS